MIWIESSGHWKQKGQEGLEGEYSTVLNFHSAQKVSLLSEFQRFVPPQGYCTLWASALSISSCSSQTNAKDNFPSALKHVESETLLKLENVRIISPRPANAFFLSAAEKCSQLYNCTGVASTKIHLIVHLRLLRQEAWWTKAPIWCWNEFNSEHWYSYSMWPELWSLIPSPHLKIVMIYILIDSHDD